MRLWKIRVSLSKGINCLRGLTVMKVELLIIIQERCGVRGIRIYLMLR